jgi:hypothetical protein
MEEMHRLTQVAGGVLQVEDFNPVAPRPVSAAASYSNAWSFISRTQGG